MCEFFPIHKNPFTQILRKSTTSIIEEYLFFFIYCFSRLRFFPPRRANKFHYIIKKRKIESSLQIRVKKKFVRFAPKLFSLTKNISSYSFPVLFVRPTAIQRNYLATLQRLFFQRVRFKAGFAKSNICEKLSNSLPLIRRFDDDRAINDFRLALPLFPIERASDQHCFSFNHASIFIHFYPLP